jgi:hypothetical protein
MGLTDRLSHAWSALTDRSSTDPLRRTGSHGMISAGQPPYRPQVRVGNEQTLITSVYTRMAVDVSGVRIEHCRVDPENEMYTGPMKTAFQRCLTVEANLDQGGRDIRRDIAYTMFNSGAAAIVPVDTDNNPLENASYDIRSMRVGTVSDWFPMPGHVVVRLYNERTGAYEELTLPKRIVAIAYNPFYSVMNAPNSTLQRLTHKLALLDNVDEISSQGKLDVIIQLPFPVKSDSRREQAELRRSELESQLKSSTYGVAWADGTEKITQLNRSVENNLLQQVQYLKQELFNELGLTENLMNGTADDAEMLNYTNRVIEPVMDSITEAMERTFITKTAWTQGQRVKYFDTPFKLIPISQLADLVDKLSRNQIVSPNEIRPVLGLKPRPEPQANALINSNMPLDQQITGEEEEEGPDPADLAEDELDAEMAALGIGV